MKTALITGITGQDGSYLAEYLLDKGYVVHGVIRRASSFNTDRIDHIYRDRHESDAKLILHYGDLADASGLGRVMSEARPDEVYHLGAQSHVRVSFDQPLYTADIGLQISHNIAVKVYARSRMEDTQSPGIGHCSHQLGVRNPR